MICRRSLLHRSAAAASLALAAPAARAQGDFPSRPLRVVVPFAPGGIIDVVARTVTDRMQGVLGRPMPVENQGGAGGTIGSATVARAAPDGHTLLVNGTGHAVTRVLFPDFPFDPLRDFAPVGLIGKQPFVLAVHPSVPARDVGSLLAWLRSKGGDANFGTTGVGAGSHLSGELLKARAGVGFTVVSYRGTPAAVTDLLAGRVDMMIDSQTLLAPLMRDGGVRGLAVTSRERSAMLPELPTLQEAGVEGYDATSWQALYAPAGTPGPIMARLAAALAQVMADPATRARFAEVGVEPFTDNSPATAISYITAEMAKWEPVLRTGAGRTP
ncbi:Bug family tripartite tricarboxylate transporter substrate binding protein [Roseomonas populi]|uniref:Tripartite tricarboxylate transporter substrate binding protein n=1 Tax=Roseomonas populi TaxID=3121582 RepID=A0ABT1X6P5_9PROT|nr:tripartite tricarboxylate transporter substrate binding protein [Roseomonas pecuniae]MCR0983758.1 tripartite tricarboxylate transporter substrate binding protein [Roseomonas pecuniae]